ncbi:IS110 family RNA-guided transposase [Caldanaerobius polysaccharolyticus]|uniref:IS110 family transposase n=1 Tax=Caldanaerobius polysaccharolyticus TaxID=44256 RepID=UPI00047D5B90|nr:IS110 family transposase [Caldanaerobius polysaccharolyticus]
MPSTLFVGIDVSSQSNSVFFIDQDGNNLIKKPFSVSNDIPGADSIISEVISHANAIDASCVKIGMEATSHYAWHLHLHLASSPDLAPFNPKFFVMNPAVVSGFKKAYTHLPKTDDFDARVIADCVRFGRVNPTPMPDFKYAALQRLTRFRYHLVQTISSEKSRALNLLYLKFSSYKEDCPFSDVFGSASTSVFDSFTPDEIAVMPMEDLVDFVLSHGNNRLSNPEEIAKTLKSAANRAYRLNPDMCDTVSMTLTMTLENIRFLESQLKKLDKEISKQLNAFRQTLTTIPGIGDVLAAGLVAEIGDVKRFKSECAVAKFAGLVWNKYQSGNFSAEDTSLAKCGNQYLRYYLVEAANCVRIHAKEYADFYCKKYNEVTKHQHKRALVLTARKLVRLVFALLSKGQIYQPGGNG